MRDAKGETYTNGYHDQYSSTYKQVTTIKQFTLEVRYVKRSTYNLHLELNWKLHWEESERHLSHQLGIRECWLLVRGDQNSRPFLESFGKMPLFICFRVTWTVFWGLLPLLLILNS